MKGEAAQPRPYPMRKEDVLIPLSGVPCQLPTLGSEPVGAKNDHPVHPGITQEVAPNESQSAPKPLTSEALIYEALFVALRL